MTVLIVAATEPEVGGLRVHLDAEAGLRFEYLVTGVGPVATALALTERLMDPEKIAEAFWYLHCQDRSCWTHELQLTPFAGRVSF